MFKLRLIEDWRNAWKFMSVHMSAAGIALMGFLEFIQHAWNFVPPYLQTLIPFGPIIAITFFALTIFGRVLASREKKCEDAKPE